MNKSNRLVNWEINVKGKDKNQLVILNKLEYGSQKESIGFWKGFTLGILIIGMIIKVLTI